MADVQDAHSLYAGSEALQKHFGIGATSFVTRSMCARRDTTKERVGRAAPR